MICPNCGGEATASVCPYCGTNLAPGPKKKDRYADFENEADPRYGNLNDNDDRWLVQDHPMKDSKVEVIGNSPVAQFLRGLANSALILACAVLMTLYAGVVCYTYGKAVFQSLDMIASNSFDSFFSIGKFSKIAFVAVSVGHVCMSVWLAVALWSLYGAGAGRKPGMSPNGLNGLQGFAKACTWIYKLLTVTGLITLVYMGFSMLADGDLSDVAEPVRTFLDSVAQMTFFAADQTGLGQVASLASDENFVRAVIFCAAAVLRLLLFAKLRTVITASAAMIRFGEVTHTGVSHVALLALINGLVVMADGALAFLTLRQSSETLLTYGPILVSGLVSVLLAAVLNRYAAGVRRMQNGEKPEDMLWL